MHEGLILCRFIHFGAVLLLFGIGAFRSLLFVPHLLPFESSPAGLRLSRLLGWLAVVALASAVAWLMLTAAYLSSDWSSAIDPSTVGRVLGNTWFGHVWIVHLLLNALVVILNRRAKPRVMLVLNALLLMTLAPVGHGAMFDGLKGQLLILNQMLHLLGVGTWLGGLWMLAWLLRADHGVDLAAVLRRFSGIGYGLVAVIIATGLINVRALSGGFWPAPALAGFGLVLAVKVLMVLGMLVLAALNRQLARAADLPVQRLKLSLFLECLCGAGALAAVSLLGTLPPMLG
ncbi:copper homeostasis membrane protein CopD [Pseudomonas sp. CFBP 13711]|uniref:copper homeostasis membrane protein CopD n=1 Tax=unclassified Pseudomonas TaxID=196821 RepID=UPI00177F3B55|nr:MULTISPECIES: copper homeostasis membrane protein CopD [unclassified Pseudomonas]MBD8709140.1 copper homeostasis membrane protein CopD [Pseudomonas sp. CFBP 13711]MBD8714176.1 copper homeostasis membrane protein CopD [Pseudomonas sp. CFBP 13715]